MSRLAFCKGVVNSVLGVLNTMKILLNHNDNAELYMTNFTIPLLWEVFYHLQSFDGRGGGGRVFEYRAWMYYYLGWATWQLGNNEEHRHLLCKAIKEVELNCPLHDARQKLEIYSLCKKSLVTP